MKIYWFYLVWLNKTMNLYEIRKKTAYDPNALGDRAPSTAPLPKNGSKYVLKRDGKWLTICFANLCLFPIHLSNCLLLDWGRLFF